MKRGYFLIKYWNARAYSFFGGEGGIRTHGTENRTTDFESVAFDHSATSPQNG